MLKAGKTGVTEDTPKKIVFGAGTIHKDLIFTPYTYAATEDTALQSGKTYYTRSGESPDYVYAAVTSPDVEDIALYYERSGGWNFETSIIGATSGGSKISIVPELGEIEIDGALVSAKDLRPKVGEKANMEINFIELTKDLLKNATLGEFGTSLDGDFDVIQSKADIETGDYLTNIAYVGKTLKGKAIIVIMENALCTSGMELEGKNKEGGVVALVFECNADLTSDLHSLPWKIYWPKME